LYKGDYWPAEPGDLPLWNPRRESREAHLLLLADARLYPISEVGHETVRRLRLNRAELIAYRRRKRIQEDEEGMLQQYKDLLTSLQQLHAGLTEALEEHRAMLEQYRALLRRLLDGNGMADAGERPPKP